MEKRKHRVQGSRYSPFLAHRFLAEALVDPRQGKEDLVKLLLEASFHLTIHPIWILEPPRDLFSLLLTEPGTNNTAS